jgi:hypothetical protein
MSNCHAEILNDLLRVEWAAAATYERAIAAVDGGPAAALLGHLCEQHRAAVQTLCSEIHQMGCDPEYDCDGPGPFALDATANVCGNALAIKALKEGEQTGLNFYEGALLDQLLPVTSQTLIRTKLLPQTRKHLEVLDQLMTVQQR